MRLSFHFWIVLFTLFSTIGLALAALDEPLFLVTRQEPAFLKALAPFVKSEIRSGRALGVRLKLPREQVPPQFAQWLESARREDFKAVVPDSKRGPLPPVDPELARILEQVDPARLRASVQKLVSVESRRVEAPGNLAMVSWTHESLSALGYESRLQCYRPTQCNVIAERRGSPNFAQPEDVVLVMAHVDSTGRAFAGADDNASGVAGLLEVARVLSQLSTRAAVRFLVFNGEEAGIVGSGAYVRSLSAQEKSRIRLAVNLDMIAYNSNGFVDIETDVRFESEARWLAEVARLYTPLVPRITTPAWGSDHVPFLKSGIPSVLAIEYWDTHTPCYHQSCDVEGALNYNYAAELTRMVLAALIEKAGR